MTAVMTQIVVATLVVTKATSDLRLIVNCAIMRIMKKSINFAQLLALEVRRPDSVHKLIEYITNPKRTGREFESYQNKIEDANKITPADLLAVSLLSVHIAQNTSSLKPTSILLLDNASISSQISDELKRIPSGLSIEETNQDVYMECVERSINIGTILKDSAEVNSRVARYKLLARKRPLLFPIRDSVLETALQMRSSKEWYMSWFKAFHDSRYEIKEDLNDIRNKVEKELKHKIDYGLLRIADMIIWERWRNLCDSCKYPQSVCVACNGSGFQEPHDPGTYIEPYPCSRCSGWNGDPDNPEYRDSVNNTWMPGSGVSCETEGCSGSKG